MSNNKVVTNLRIDRNSWLQIKVMAAELGMSVNGYINHLIKDLTIRKELIGDRMRAPIWNLGKITEKIKPSPLGELSPDDKLIYE